jgi:hypothetical protein
LLAIFFTFAPFAINATKDFNNSFFMIFFFSKHITLVCFLLLSSLFFPALSALEITAPALKFEVSSHYGAGSQLPFWLLSNQYGKYNTDKSGILSSVAIFGNGGTLENWGFGYGLEGVGRVTQGLTTGWLHQAFGKAEYRKFLRFQAGVWEETFGNQYTPLSSGSIIWSQNARPMPKVEIGSAGYVDVPFTKGLFQGKGALAHGWFEKDRYVEGVWLHHKYAAARTRFDFPLNFNFAFHHFAMWGGNHPVFGQLPSDLDAFTQIFLVGKGGDDAPVSDQLNRSGNHIGSRHYGIDWQQPGYAINIYFQDIYEDGSGARWKNFPDGLWGVVWKNSNTAAPIVAVLYEYLQTTNQSGAVHQAVGLPGDDNYFNHSIYRSGWTHHIMTIGTPFITSPVYLQSIENPENYRMWNNRVRVHYLGIMGRLTQSIDYKFRISYAENKGLFASNITVPEQFLFENPLDQVSWMAEINYLFPSEKWQLKTIIAGDTGEMYGNNFALQLGVVYRPIITFD